MLVDKEEYEEQQQRQMNDLYKRMKQFQAVQIGMKETTIYLSTKQGKQEKMVRGEEENLGKVEVSIMLSS